MPNICVSTIDVTGEGAEDIKKLYDGFAIPLEFGCAWRFPNRVDRYYCDVKHGDGITIIDGGYRIRGETAWRPPVGLMIELSTRYPNARIKMGGTDLSNFAENWVFEGGVGKMVDFWKYIDNEMNTQQLVENGVVLIDDAKEIKSYEMLAVYFHDAVNGYICPPDQPPPDFDAHLTVDTAGASQANR